MTDIITAIGLFTIVVMTLVLAVLGARALISRRETVTITVNGASSFAAQTGQKLLEVLRDNGVLVPSTCAGSGTCGLCRVNVPTGGGHVLPTELAKLDRTERRNHVRLACQVVIRGNVEVWVPEDLLGTEKWECRVASTHTLTPFIREIVLDLPSAATPHFHAGCFVQVTTPPYDLRFADFEIPEKFEHVWERSTVRKLSSRSRTDASRAYSIANTPKDQDTIVLNVRLALPPPTPTLKDVPPGIVSSYLFTLKAGDKLKIAGPYGSFRATDSDREMIFIGGGVGLTPLRAIIFEQLETIATPRKISFWYGARSRIELFYENEFNELQAKYRNFSWTVALSEPKPDDNWEGPVGFIHDVVYETYLRDHCVPEECEYYLCGPPLMIQSVMSMLGDLGVGPDNIFFDDFGS